MLGDLRHLVEALALAGGSGGDVVEGDRARETALVVLAVGVVLYFLAGHDLAEVEPGLLSQLYGLLARELVAGVVERQQQHAVTLVGALHGLEHQLGVGRGKDVAHSLDVQHALADKAGLRGLVPGAAVGDDGHAIRVLQILAYNQMPVDGQDVGIGQTQADKLLVGDGLGGVDKLLHFHSRYHLFSILFHSASPRKKYAMDTAPASGVPMVCSP